MTHRHIFYSSANRGACCTSIEVQLDDGIITAVRFVDGCYGNHQGIEALVKGMKATDAISRLKGIVCRNGTSCPDQLALALTEALAAPPASSH